MLDETKKRRKNIAASLLDDVRHYQSRLREGDNDSGATKSLANVLNFGAGDLRKTVPGKQTSAEPYY